METLDLTALGGMRLEEVEWAGNILSANFGAGYGADAVNDPESGLHRWSLRSGGVWPDRSIAGIDIAGDTRFEYYWEFFKRHTTGTTRIFILRWRGKSYHASFVEPRMSVQRFVRTLDIYEMGGVQIRQRRIPGVVYGDDGSVDVSAPCVPEGLALEVTGTTSMTATWEAASDDCGQIEGDGGGGDDGDIG